MDFDKKKVGIGLVCTLALGSAIAYGSLASKDNKTEETTSSSQVASPIERAKGKDKKENPIKKSQKSGSNKTVLDNLFGEESEASVIDPLNDGEKTFINRDPINNILSDIDKQAQAEAAKAKDELQQKPSIPAVENQKPTSTDNKDSNKKSEDTDVQGPSIVPPVVDPTPQPIPEPTPDPEPPIVTVNYAGLISVLEQASRISRSNYTPNSLKELDAETTVGYNMISAQTSSQQQVNYQVTKIKNAINSLVTKADKSVLTAKLSDAKSKDLELYTPETAEKLVKEIEDAQAIQNDDNASQAAVDAQNESLQRAIDQLIKRADKSILDQVISEAKNVNRAIYLEDSLAELDTALAAAEVVQNNLNATQEKVDQAKDNLRAAIDGLQEKEEPEKTLVLIKQLIAECESLVKSEYTPQSYQVLESEISLANALVEKPNVTIAEASAQLISLENAKNQLVKVADTSKLQAAISEAKTLNEDDYTGTSWSILQSALSGAEALIGDQNATQAQVDQKESQIRVAISTLEEK